MASEAWENSPSMYMRRFVHSVVLTVLIKFTAHETWLKIVDLLCRNAKLHKNKCSV